MKGRQIKTRITCEEADHYYVIIDGRREGLSWYGAHLSPEGQPDNTEYIIAQELDKDYGNFLGWYIEEILNGVEEGGK